MTDSIPGFEILSNAVEGLPSDERTTTCAGLGRTGYHAYREISSRLRGYPGAQQLLEEVYQFYGSCLSYVESGDFPSTLYAIHLHHQHPIALKSASIQLQLGTGRTAEALTHELLHLHLPMLGFPLGESVRIPLQFDHYAPVFLSMCNWVVNVVQHEINFHRFVALGFDRGHFLAKPVAPMDYQKLFEPDPENRHRGGDDFSRWCIEYIRHLLTARHGGSKDGLQHAKDALNWGSRYHPELKETAAEIDRWLENRVFEDSDQYPRQVNVLLGLMRIPEFTGWVTLKRSGRKRALAVRLDTKRICSASFMHCSGQPLYHPVE